MVEEGWVSGFWFVICGAEEVGRHVIETLDEKKEKEKKGPAKLTQNQPSFRTLITTEFQHQNHSL